jgi:hypothetical protein
MSSCRFRSLSAFGSPSGLFSVLASGGVPVQITAVDPARHEIFHAGPSFLPNGRHLIFLGYSTDREKSASRLDVQVVFADDQKPSRILFRDPDLFLA